jgi:hypothetical protein
MHTQRIDQEFRTEDLRTDNCRFLGYELRGHSGQILAEMSDDHVIRLLQSASDATLLDIESGSLVAAATRKVVEAKVRSFSQWAGGPELVEELVAGARAMVLQAHLPDLIPEIERSFGNEHGRPTS